MHVNACSTGNAHPTLLLVAVLFIQWRSCYVYHRNSKERVAPVETSLVNKAQKMVLNILWGCIFEKTASLLEPIVVFVLIPHKV